MTNRTELFNEEATEQLRQIEHLLLSIEQGDGERIDETVDAVFRCIHTIKGGADFLGLPDVKRLAHETETVLEAVRRNRITLDSSAISTLLRVIDTLLVLVSTTEDAGDRDVNGLVKELQSMPIGEPDKAVHEETPTQEQPLVPHTPEFTQFTLNLNPQNPREFESRLEEIGYLIDKRQIGKEGTFAKLRYVFRTVLDRELCARYLSVAPADLADSDQEQQPPAPQSAQYPAKAQAATDGDTGTLPAPRAISEASRLPAIDGSLDAAPDQKAVASIRVNVELLDTLMNLAGELVLTRNQMNQNVESGDMQSVLVAAQRLDAVTTELQASIMSTRMQPIGVVLAKFHRLTRDLAVQLEKKVELIIEGEDVELDKTIIENIADPLTHLVRNAIDHGIEPAADRERCGKPSPAVLTISARHEAGHVVVEVYDDGRGIDAARIRDKALELGLLDRSRLDDLSERELLRLIFAPGFTTAGQLSDVSGRGVGMDVVSTNLSKLGGSIDVETEVGKGTRISLKLPLTLAIIPCLLVSTMSESYAIPQVNLVELLRIIPEEHDRIDKVGNNSVIRVRDRLLPVVWLGEYLGIEPSGAAPARMADQSIHVAIVSAGEQEYGIAVDNLMDSEEIVVKPLGSHLRNCRAYAGATILGDGRTALILDVAGIAESIARGNERSKDGGDSGVTSRMESAAGEAGKLIIMENAVGEFFCVPLSAINRIEKVHSTDIEKRGSRSVIKYKGSVLRVFELQEAVDTGSRPEGDTCFLLIFQVNGMQFSVAVTNVIDIVDSAGNLDTATFRQSGIAGSVIISSNITLMLDLKDFVATVEPDFDAPAQEHSTNLPTILIAEDSVFFQDKLQEVIRSIGLAPLIADDGQSAWELMDSGRHQVDLVLTDIEMPRMDGLTLARAIRRDPRFRHTPIIMLTSLARESDIRAGREAGADDYLIKMDPETVKQTVLDRLDQSRREVA